MRRHSADLRTMHGVWHNRRLRLQQSCRRTQLEDVKPPSERRGLPAVPVSPTVGLLRIFQHSHMMFSPGRERRSGRVNCAHTDAVCLCFLSQRCDAKQPYCTACKTSNKKDQCVYEDDAQRNLIQCLVARTRELEERLAFAEQSSHESRPHHGNRVSSPGSAPVLRPSSLAIEAFRAFPVWKPPRTDLPVSALLTSRTTLELYRDL